MTPTVLHVIDTTGPGGAETVFLDLAQECLRRGYNSIAVIRGPGWVEDQLRKRGIPYEIHDCKGSLNVRFLATLVRIVRRHRVTHIQSHLLGSNVYTSLVGLLTRVRVTATFHGHVDISENERFRNAKLAIIRAGACHVVAVTEDLKNSINRTTSGLSRLDAVVIPNGIDINQLETLPLKALGQQPGPVVFGCLGNIRPAKNYTLAVDFIAMLRKEGVDAVLRIAGDDTKPEANELKKHVADVGAGESVAFLGFIEDVAGFLESIDVFLMTSSSEGHPLALTQALAAGKPVVSTRNGVERIVPEEFMFLAEDHTPQALNEGRSRLWQTDRLPDLLARGREYVKDNYSLNAMFGRYFRLYEL